eukprot:gnl/TRDRNA2_/TRDRNA2_73673_c0_seq1.p1 gnl/TRDRNA2_/TRDRNA2_73673_c0~~gnl/TRDRNA2_/TRDRNA2_73673_c0_seq1.p1  ORF type:complete len:241 (+),score=10.76 gnl/TRDRNA2_/TRDRNA2_73673_c0_seq1:52-723(+)
MSLEMSELSPLGRARDCSDDPCILHFYMYAVIAFEVGDYSELGSVDIVLSHQFPESVARGQAVILLCYAHGSRAWHQRVVQEMDNWLANGRFCKHCGHRRAQGLWRAGSAPPIHWRCWIGAGEIWMGCCRGVYEQAIAHRRLEARNLVHEYKAIMLREGFEMNISFSSDTIGDTSLVKCLHCLDSVHIRRVIQILKDAVSGTEQLDFRLDFVVGLKDPACNLL